MMKTEQRDGRVAGLDRWEDADILLALLESQSRALASVKAALPDIATAANAMAGALGAGGRLVYAGAGSSISIAAQDGAELPATFGLDPARLVFLIAGGREAIFDINGAAEDDDVAGRSETEALELTQKDALVALSASGTTPYTLAAARAARAAQAVVIGIANNKDTPLLAAATHAIFLDSDSEVVAGSTRLAAGTAQKCALSLLSTLAHIRLGCVYDGHMINLRADNAKLRQRARTMVAMIANVDDARAGEALRETEGHVAPAALICCGAGDARAAQALMAEAKGNLRIALESLARS